MNKVEFELINTIEKLQKNFYFFITDMSDGTTRLSDAAAEYFQMKEGSYKNFYQLLEKFVHPFDLEEYREGMDIYLRLEELDDEFCIRFVNGIECCMYSFLMDKYEADGKTFLIIILRNENKGPQIDYLTNLYGVSRFENDIEKAMNSKERTVILHLDINHMEDIAVIYGQRGSRHIYGDVATMFIYMMDQNKAVYRVTDTGFTFILRDDDRESALAFAARARDVIESKIVFNGQRLPLTCSFGAILLKDYEDDTDTIIGKLNHATDISRAKRRDEVVFFNDLVSFNQNTDLDLIKVIHSSVQSGCEGFFLDYQPIVSSEDGKIVGAESLVRWKKEEYGIIPPGFFIEWMEKNSAMYVLGNFVLKRALTEAKIFLEKNPKFFINVNVSEKQIERPTFREDLEAIIKETNFPRQNICLELTERCKRLPIDMLRAEVEYFKNSGIRVALDDYGTGSASSSVVLAVPVDEIKIDMSFVKGIQNNERQQALVKNMIDFANEAGLYSCIEGVEDEPLQDFLRAFGATWFQGYFYSKPTTPELLYKML